MKQFVHIKEIKSQEGETLFKVNAILLQSKNGEQQKKIPHPFGTETMIFKSLDKAKEAVILSGFKYVLPDGSTQEEATEYKIEPYDKKIFDTIIKQTKDTNPNIVAAAISALSEINHPDSINLYIEKLGEENDIIRQNSIEAVLKYGTKAIPKVVDTLKDENWVRRNSAVLCLQQFCTKKDIDTTLIIEKLLESINDTNPIVKCSVIKALGLAYKNYKSQ